MIRKVAVFVVLLVAGFALLRVLIDDEQVIALDKDKPAGTGQTQSPTPPGIRVNSDGNQITLTHRGHLRIDGSRTVAQPDGSLRTVRQYMLECQDSEPAGNGLQLMREVQVKLFDDNQHVADLFADQAIAALGVDRFGKQSLDAGKDVRLRNTRLQTIEGGRLSPMTLTLGNVLATVEDAQIKLRSETPDQRIELSMTGERAVSFRGVGMTATMPKDKAGRVEHLDLVIDRECELDADGIHVLADGPLHYVEHTADGSARLELSNRVRLDLSGDQLGTGKTSTVNADRLLGWLLRTRSPEGPTRSSRTAWRFLELRGAPAVVDSAQLVTRTGIVQIVPGIGGQPHRIVCTGGTPELVQSDARGSTTFTASERIDVERPDAQLGEIHRLFGFPGYSLRPLRTLQLVGFTGRSAAKGGHGVNLDAGRNMTVAQLDVDDPDGAIWARGGGRVELERGSGSGSDGDPVTAGSDRGFHLLRTRQGERLRLNHGDGAASPFTIRRGDLHIAGTGTAAFEQRADGVTVVQLDSPGAEDITCTLAPHGARVLRARDVRAELRGEQLLRLLANGRDLEADLTERAGITGRAPTIELIEHGVLELRGAPLAKLTQTERDDTGAQTGEFTFEGPVLQILQSGDKAANLVALVADGRRPRAFGTVTRPDGNQVTFDLHADDLRLLSRLLPAESLAMFGPLLPAPFDVPTQGAAAQPFLLARQHVEFTIEDPKSGTLRGNGRRLVLGRQSQSALLVGDELARTPAELVQIEPDGRRTRSLAARARFGASGGDVELLDTFADGAEPLPPIVELHQGPGGNRELAHLRGSCTGRIAVLPDRVDFHGPAHVYGIDEAGQQAPGGLDLTAARLMMKRNRTTGAVEIVEAGTVDLDWSRIRARAEEMTLDLRWQRCIVQDSEFAEVWLPRGQHLRVRRAEVNYASMTYTAWKVSGQPQGLVLPK